MTFRPFPISALTLAALMGVGSPALACGQLTPQQQARMMARWEAWLAGMRQIAGIYRDGAKHDPVNAWDEETQDGAILSPSGKTRAETVIYGRNTIILCTLARLPYDGEHGRFYLKRNDGGRLRIFHFVPDGAGRHD